jgi:bacteriocin biosynthesis cyclodehydratase domain-containing protein
MANALRMTVLMGPARLYSTVISGGTFGRRVAGLLVDNEAGSQTTYDQPIDGAGIESAFDHQGASIVIALSRPDPELCESADRLAFERNRIWLPIVMEHPVISIGPLVRPPGGPCFTCSHRRRVQHEIGDELSAVVQAAYMTDPVWGPEGYLPHHARLAAAIGHGLLLASGLGDGRADDEVLHSVVTIQLMNNYISGHRVLACHDCVRCEPRWHSGDAGSRDWIPQNNKSLKRHILETLRQ